LVDGEAHAGGRGGAEQDPEEDRPLAAAPPRLVLAAEANVRL
jgi:hypothetical protein